MINYEVGNVKVTKPNYWGVLILSYSKMAMHQVFLRSGAYEKFNVYYTDTDSVIVNYDGLKGVVNMIDDGKLGMLSDDINESLLEVDSDNETIFNPDDYINEKKISNNQSKEIEANEIMNELINAVGRENIAYGDTDSIYVRKAALSKVEKYLGTGLCKFKNDYGDKVITYGIFLDNKRYYLEFSNGRHRRFKSQFTSCDVYINKKKIIFKFERSFHY